MPQLTLCMIVKNEETFLQDCLKSVEGIVDEIVLIDTGSSDKTIKIAEENCAKVYHFDWINDFSAARNYALSKSTGDWILYLDADERLTRRSVKEIKEIIKSRDLIGVNCLINNIDEISGSPKLMKYVRLFRNSKNIKFTGRVHEQIESSLIENKYSIIESNIEITHLGYNVCESGLREKAERNLYPLLEEYKVNESSYYAFQLANTYKILGNVEEELRYHKLALTDPELKNEYKSVGYLALADHEMRNNNVTEALRNIIQGLEYDNKHPLLNLVASQVYHQLKDYDSAIQHCKTAFIENRKIINKEVELKSIDIVVNEKKILFHGLYLAATGNESGEIQYFLGKIKQLENCDNDEIQIIIKLLNNMSLTTYELSMLEEFVNAESLDAYLAMIANISDKKIKLETLLSLNNKFEKNAKYLTALGLQMSNNGLMDEASRIFENSLQLKEKDPATIFYLVSIYVEKNDYEKIPNILEIAMNEFAHLGGFQEKLKLMMKKLEPILIN